MHCGPAGRVHNIRVAIWWLIAGAFAVLGLGLAPAARSAAARPAVRSPAAPGAPAATETVTATISPGPTDTITATIAPGPTETTTATISPGPTETNTPGAEDTATPTVTPSPGGDIRLSGWVRTDDGGTGLPVAGAVIAVTMCVPRTFSAASAMDGSYDLLIPADYANACQAVTISVTAEGYQQIAESELVERLRESPVRDFWLVPARFAIYLPWSANEALAPDPAEGLE